LHQFGRRGEPWPGGVAASAGSSAGNGHS
jgi:hypothetical protein